MSEATQQACDAIARRAAEIAKDADPERLEQLARAVQAVHFAPQDGAYTYKYDGEYHYHTHPHELDRDNDRSTGFGDGR